jgi:hypothetical protein
LAVWEWDEAVAFEKIEDTLPEQVHDNADMASEVETISEVDAAIPILDIVGLECLQYSKFDSAGIAVLLDRPDNFDSHIFVSPHISGLNDLAKGSLAEELVDSI